MKKIYTIIFLFFSFILTILGYDFSIYIYTYNELIKIQETVCDLVSINGGITNNVKQFIYEKNMFVEYEKSGDVNGATYEFSLCKTVDYLFLKDTKYIKLDLVVILGY